MRLSIHKLIFASALLLLPIHGLPTEPDLEARQSCTINLDFIRWWSEALLIRRRFRPTQSGINDDLEKVLHDDYESSRGGQSNCQSHRDILDWALWSEIGIAKSNLSNIVCASVPTSNVQIFLDKTYGWVVDSSEVAGPAGENVHHCIIDHMMDKWRGNSGCVIQSDSCGRPNQPMCQPEYQNGRVWIPKASRKKNAEHMLLTSKSSSAHCLRMNELGQNCSTGGHL